MKSSASAVSFCPFFGNNHVGLYFRQRNCLKDHRIVVTAKKNVNRYIRNKKNVYGSEFEHTFIKHVSKKSSFS